MVARLVEEIQGWVIGDVSHQLMWVSEPTAQGDCYDELAAEGRIESLGPDMPVLGRGLFMLPN